MRITNRMITENAIQHMAKNKEAIQKISEKIASGKNFQVSSDDPVNASYALNLRSTLRMSQAYRSTATLSKDWMSASEFALQQMEGLAVRAEGLILRGLNDTMGDDERKSALASEMKALFQQALDIANTQHKGQYVFSGFAVNQASFALADALDADGNPVLGADGQPLKQVRYTGGTGTMLHTVSPGQQIAVNVPGEEALKPILDALYTAQGLLDQNKTAAVDAGLRAALGELESAADTVSSHRTTNGARLRQAETAADYLDKVEVEVMGLLSQKEDVNLAEAITQLRSQETSYQSVLEVSQRAVSALSLFDYLR